MGCALHLWRTLKVSNILVSLSFHDSEPARASMGHSATRSVSGEPFLCFLGTTRPFGKRVLWTLKFLDPKKKKTKTASKHGDKKKAHKDDKDSQQTHQTTVSPEMACLQQVFLWASRTLDPPPEHRRKLKTCGAWDDDSHQGVSAFGFDSMFDEMTKTLNCTNLSEHWEALQPTKVEYTVLMVLAQVVKKKSHCMASLRSRTTHGCAFSVFFLGLWSSSTAGAVRNSWSQTAAGSEAVGSFL